MSHAAHPPAAANTHTFPPRLHVSESRFHLLSLLPFITPLNPVFHRIGTKRTSRGDKTEGGIQCLFYSLWVGSPRCRARYPPPLLVPILRLMFATRLTQLSETHSDDGSAVKFSLSEADRRAGASEPLECGGGGGGPERSERLSLSTRSGFWCR